MRRLRAILALLLLPALSFVSPSFNDVTCAQSCVPPPDNLVSWWPGDGDALDFVGDNDGTLVNGATYAPGMVDQAFSFDGIDDYVSIPDDDSLNPTEALTVDAWIYPLGTGTAHPVVKKAGEGLGQQNGYALEHTANQIVFWVYLDGAGWVPSPPGLIVLDEWNHAAGVYDGEYVRLYLNGEEIASPTYFPSSILPSSNELDIGRDPSNPGRLYSGLIDEVGIFDRALGADEIVDIYEAGSAGKCKSETLIVDIEISPGTGPSCLSINDRGSVEVAILGSDTFDVNDINARTLNFAGLDVLFKGKSNPKCLVEFVDNDGYEDLVCQFEDDSEAWAPDDENTATLTGTLSDGTPFQGSDDFCIR